MPRPKKWVETNLRNGIKHARLSSWKYFHDFINQTLLDYPGYIFRGQRSEHWKLESTLNRLIKYRPTEEPQHTSKQILARFIFAIRGRRGATPSKLSIDELWSLGQHHGLATPLLDWTTSPYVAAFFAFAENRDSADGDATVWAIHHYSVVNKSEALQDKASNTDESVVIRHINPLTDENARLVNQSGCFLYLPEGTELEEWTQASFPENEDGTVLLKITIPEKDREFALICLNRMNINYLSLFPDLLGASMHANLSTVISKYG